MCFIHSHIFFNDHSRVVSLSYLPRVRSSRSRTRIFFRSFSHFTHWLLSIQLIFPRHLIFPPYLPSPQLLTQENFAQFFFQKNLAKIFQTHFPNRIRQIVSNSILQCCVYSFWVPCSESLRCSRVSSSLLLLSSSFPIVFVQSAVHFSSMPLSDN
jgi:hypothetical protein